MLGTAGEVVLRELIEPFHDLPTTIDLRGRGLARSGRSGKQTQVILQRLLANPNVDLSRRRLRTTLSRFDSEYPSISNLSPLSPAAGPDRLVYAPMSDETAYSNDGRGRRKRFSRPQGNPSQHRLAAAAQAIQHQLPCLCGRVSGSASSRLRTQLQEASLAALTPVRRTAIAAIVDGFFSARIDRVGSATWRISNRGALQTVRFDAAESREVDFGSSIGVIGQRRKADALYVALDETIEPAVVVLGPPAPSHALHSQGLALRRKSMARPPCCERSMCACALRRRAMVTVRSPGRTPASGRYIITVDRGGKEVWRQTRGSR